MARHKDEHLAGDQTMTDSKREAHLFGEYLNHFKKRTTRTTPPEKGHRCQREDNLYDDDDEPNNPDDDHNDSNSNGSNSHGQTQNYKTTETQTMMHILKANIGTGVLAMPIAFRHVGLWLGLCLLPLIGAICIHCMNILIDCHNSLCDRFNYESLDYDQVAALALACGPKCTRRVAKWANLVVSVFLMITQIGFCCVYTLFAVENLQLAMFNLFNLDYSTNTYLIITFPIIGLASCTSNLKHLARISTLANILQSVGLALIFYDLLQFNTYKDLAFGGDGGDSTNTGNSSTSYSMDVKVEQGFAKDIAAGLPLFFATAVYAFEGIGVVLPLIKEMQYPYRISGPNGVLNTSMCLVGLLYMAMGFFGYAKYGQHVAGSITLNLPETTLNELVRLCFAIAIGLSYSLQFYVPWTIIWPLIDESLFYSYRPRVARDKLDILNRLSAKNHWAIDELVLQDGRASEGDKDEDDHHNDNDDDDEQNKTMDDNQSDASTFATSYSMSIAPKRHVAGCLSTTNSFSAAASSPHYGTILISNGGGGGGAQKPGQTKARRLRNRLDDVREHDDDDHDDLPQVQWRPPPRSMRGKRKLVRYTVILLTVSFTFVAAALIPRLDLFISLIGALASSCLAIIFPAIIQMCTYWKDDDQDDEDEDEDDHHHDEDDHSTTGTFDEGPARRHRSRSRTRRRRIRWLLFAAKNAFLLLFGCVGLVTGTWISLAQLGIGPAA